MIVSAFVVSCCVEMSGKHVPITIISCASLATWMHLKRVPECVLFDHNRNSMHSLVIQWIPNYHNITSKTKSASIVSLNRKYST